MEENYKFIIAFSINWFLISFLSSKFTRSKLRIKANSLRVVITNLFSLFFFTSILYYFNLSFSNEIILFTTALITFEELIASNIYLLTINLTPCIDEETIGREFIKTPIRQGEVEDYEPNPDLKAKINSLTDTDSRRFIFNNIVQGELDETLFVSTNTRFNIENQMTQFHNVVNLKLVNHVQRLNKFFETINKKLPTHGLFIGKVETYSSRKTRILNKFFGGFNYIYYCLDFILKRIFPKLMLTKGIYFFLTRGLNRVISKAETFGRLYSCGFEVVDEVLIKNELYFAARKIQEPVFDMNPTYGPLIKLRRVGKGGRIFNVYKFRTMHPYAEYLQPYIYNKNNLDKGGKFKNDFRVTTLGRIFRKFWVDELPMLYNLIKGDIKIVGVRPLSEHYYNLYTEVLKEKRILTKSGLIPPFYADLPKTMDEIMESEINYLDKYQQNPIKTDLIYFKKALSNILLKKARSQ